MEVSVHRNYKRVYVNRFGGPEELVLKEETPPEPGPGEVRVRLTSIGINHADLMARRGEYRLSSGSPPFTPGLEGGGIIDAVHPDVSGRQIGDRVILGAAAPKPSEPSGPLRGTYRTHFTIQAEDTIVAPANLPDDMLGTLWLTYLTAWGCLVWKQEIKRGTTVAIPAASSGVALAAAQIARNVGAIPIGLTTSVHKKAELEPMAEAPYETIIVTNTPEGRSRSWHRDLLKLTAGHGIDVFFDPVASGEYLDNEIRALAMNGTIWIYGLLGQPGRVDVSPLIRKRGTIRGWMMHEVIEAGPDVLSMGYSHIVSGFASGSYSQPVADRFPLGEVQEAHKKMEQGRHIGKFVLIP